MLIFYLQLSLLSADLHFQKTKLCCKTRKPSTAGYFLDLLGCTNSKSADDFSGFESHECLSAACGDNVTSDVIYVHTFGAEGGTIGQNMPLKIMLCYLIKAFYPFSIAVCHLLNDTDNEA